MNTKTLVEQILRLCEKQYRKGVQHGCRITYAEADDFRHNGRVQLYRKAVDLNGDEWSKRRQAHQMHAECAMQGMQELRQLLQDYADQAE